MFPSDERVFAHGSENSAGKKKTGNKISGGVKKSAEGRFFFGFVFDFSLEIYSKKLFLTIFWGA